MESLLTLRQQVDPAAVLNLAQRLLERRRVERRRHAARLKHTLAHALVRVRRPARRRHLCEITRGWARIR